MRYLFSYFLAAALIGACLQSPALAGENKLAKGAQKIGQAVIWPVKKLGQGMKAAGTGVKNALSRKK